VEIFLNEEFLYSIVVHHTFSCYSGSGCSVPEELLAHDTFSYLCRLIKFASDVNTMRGGLPLPVRVICFRCSGGVSFTTRLRI
jgi:hypothetical protein